MKNCWLHDWSKWTDKETSEIMQRPVRDKPDDEIKIGNYIVQERRCARCNKIQLRTECTRIH